ncbi:RNA polymerase sigma factor [Methylomonas sp. CM2]|uniref:RNA polymerase sigma factor n=1 Tax=Methylomonas sp. CM2 TaxID=3417647 RepID=UPI003CF8F7A0
MNKTIAIDEPLTWPTETAAAVSINPSLVGKLYDDHYQDLQRYLRRHCPDRESMEVILQEVYLKLLEMDDLSAIQTPGAYLNRLARNLLIDHYRRRQREGGHWVNDSEEVWENADAGFDHETDLHYRQQLETYERLLQQLPPPIPDVVYLNRYQGVSLEQIAKRYGKSKSWVEKTIAKALLYCRQRMQDF